MSCQFTRLLRDHLTSRVPNSPKKYYPHLITLGQSVNLKYIAQKMQGYSSLSIGDIKSVIQNFVEKMKEQLLEGKSVNIEGFGRVYVDCLLERGGCGENVNAKRCGWRTHLLSGE